VFFLLSLLLSHLVVAQDTTRARKNLNMLASEKMKGRGYLFNGHKNAAKCIVSEMKKAGLRTIQGSYFQDFTMAQNLFPKEPELQIGNNKLKAGADFIPSPDCPSISGNFVLRSIDSIQENNGQLIFPEAKKEEAWIISLSVQNKLKKASDWKALSKNGPGLVILPKQKLTHSLSEEQSGFAMVQILESSLNRLKLNLNTNLPHVVKVKISAIVKKDIKTSNLIGVSKGTSKSDSIVVVCAHYDHLGALGKKVFFPGANDNASGTAMLLEMAYYFQTRPHVYDIVFIAFTGEEAGLLGSFHFVNHPLFPLKSIKFVLNLDLMGFGDKGATVVNGTILPTQFSLLQKINAEKGYLPIVNARGKASNSDHYPFSEAGVPAFFVYTLGGPGYYHDVFDKPETVTFSKFTSVFRWLIDFLNSL